MIITNKCPYSIIFSGDAINLEGYSVTVLPILIVIDKKKEINLEILLCIFFSVGVDNLDTLQ